MSGPPADGIVVLTGGQDRIPEAVELLSAARGKRLLISGVNAAVSAETLARQLPRAAALFQCCVDLDHRALNTAGNAEEAANWASRNSHRSLIVVTSGYHMPRAMIEFRRALPAADLRPHAVTVPQSGPDAAQAFARFRLLATEYSKLLFAFARSRFS